ncbi:MAG TPA: hypothetical protein VFO10_29275 [Oligoflexus sp.]|uniref:hypothetical protein n=1 Tax=Oligoflexus sp. TaxID=1971216 RepID=UPI002D7F3BB1|nr:hypothetical protein [Oligoflexus sp.]HET9241394.1 hypothetical protein [Oligoflexus sp.]
MSKQDVSAIVADLDRWAVGQFGPKLTWEMLEDRFGFSRQSLQAKPEIKAAYDLSKKTLSKGLRGPSQQALKSNETLQLEIEKLKVDIAKYKKLEVMWKKRWQQIAFHIRQRGYQLSHIDNPINELATLLSDNEVEQIIGEFDKEIPSSGRS